MRQFLSTLIILFCMMLLMINSFCEGMRFSAPMPMPMEVLMITAICIYVIHNGYMNTVEFQAKKKRIEALKKQRMQEEIIQEYYEFREQLQRKKAEESEL